MRNKTNPLGVLQRHVSEMLEAPPPLSGTDIDVGCGNCDDGGEKC